MSDTLTSTAPQPRHQTCSQFLHDNAKIWLAISKCVICDHFVTQGTILGGKIIFQGSQYLGYNTYFTKGELTWGRYNNSPLWIDKIIYNP